MPEYEKYIIPEAADGWRLDKALMLVSPDTGLRYRRRLCDDGHVVVEGKSRKPGYKVHSGQEVKIREPKQAGSHIELGLRIVERSDDFAAVYKPSGVHSAAVAGKESVNVESLLSEMFAGEKTVLLNRLDFLTSGLLLVALNEQAVKRYRQFEVNGEIKKFYLAEVRGRLDGMTTVRFRVCMDNRKKSNVVAELDGDERRWTSVESLSHDHLRDTTLVRCLIMRGARHQIRVHLAFLGYPIVGDPLYGNETEPEGLRLHHQRVELPGFSAECDVQWAD